MIHVKDGDVKQRNLMTALIVGNDEGLIKEILKYLGVPMVR